MIVKLLTEQHLEFLSLKGCCTGSSESTLVTIPHCWKSHVTAQISLQSRSHDLYGCYTNNIKNAYKSFFSGTNGSISLILGM